MAATQQTEKPRFIDRAGWQHFIRSNYVTWFTEWLLQFGGKSAHVVLILTTLYMSAQLYPGIHLPDGLSVAVFLIQMFALDMGGMGLASLARQAQADGNEEGARSAKKLSNWLIGIMIAGLVTVCLEQALSHIPHLETIQGYVDAAKVAIELVLVVARAICAVLYGKTIHTLRQVEPVSAPAPAQATPVQPPVDLEPLQAKIAELEATIAQLIATKTAQPGATSTGKSEDQEEDNDKADTQDETGQDNGQPGATNIRILHARNQDKQQAKPRTTGTQAKATTKATKAARYIKNNPNITAPELARKAQIDVSYARRLLAQRDQVVNG